MDIHDLNESWYLSVVNLMARVPDSLHQTALHTTDSIVVLLALLLIATAWRYRTRTWPQKALLITTPAAVCLAYAASEVLKVLVSAERPCRAITEVTVVAEHCPRPGDWSFPSNHATVAAGLATAIALLSRRMIILVVPLAALAAVSRVAVGVHYPYDVLCGAALGVLITLTVSVTTVPPAARLASQLRRRHR